MLSWLARKLITHNMARSRAGDIEPTLRLDAADVTFRFPGENSWGGEYHGKEQVRRWLERFVAAGVQVFPDEVVAVGWPWRSTVCIRGHASVRSPEGETVYENRFVIWAALGWGRVKEYEVYEDTQKAAALDRWLAEHRPELAAIPAT
ncbi:MAG: nuclear transport factor 2 family protein [Actinomycetota bacterium]|nr:nuclear transport factor 2 family protein [Actinomycetota bacterium]